MVLLYVISSHTVISTVMRSIRVAEENVLYKADVSISFLLGHLFLHPPLE